MASVCRILFFQQIKLEKNGFHSLKERQSSFHTLQNCHLNTCILLESGTIELDTFFLPFYVTHFADLHMLTFQLHKRSIS